MKRIGLFVTHIVWLIAVVAAYFVGSSENKPNAVSKSLQVGHDASSVAKPTDIPVDSSSISEPIFETVSRSDDSDLQLSDEPLIGGRKALNEEDILALGAILSSERDPVKRSLAFTRLLEGITPDNAVLIREQVGAAYREGSKEFRQFHYAWGAITGGEAVIFATETPERDMASALSGWASVDPEAALAYMQNHDNPSIQGYLKKGFINGVFNRNPGEGANMVYRLAEQSSRRERENLMELVADRMIYGDGLEKAVSFMESLPDGELRGYAMARLGRRYVEKDPEGAIDWTLSLESGPNKHEAISAVSSRLGRNNLEVALSYIGSMEDSSDRDHAIHGAINGMSRRSPESALMWAGEINDEKMRNDALLDAGRRYFRKDPASAMEWLADSDLPEKVWNKVTGR